METDPTFPDPCAACGGPVLPVLYGMPPPDMWEAEERGELIIGGCIPEETAYSCQCGQSRFDRNGSPIREFGVDDARWYISQVRWQFAKTMPQWPHEYTVREWQPEHTDAFFAFVTLIREVGVVKPWPADSPTPRYHHTYLEIDGWDYWTMGDAIDETELINRARIGDSPTDSSPIRAFGTG